MRSNTNTNTTKEAISKKSNQISKAKSLRLKPVMYNAKKENTVYSDDFLNKLIHKIGHDLRSPVFVVKSYSQLLTKTKEPERLDRGLGMMQEATTKMEALINSLVELMDIYTLSRPSDELILIESALNKAKVRLYEDLIISNPKITINFKSYPVVRFAESYLTDIFYELVGNAVKHNKEQQDLHIEINTYKKEGKLILEIKDNGKGISDLDDKYFEPFYSYSTSGTFSGVGLSKVQAIAKVCDGHIEIENSIDKGIVCRYYF